MSGNGEQLARDPAVLDERCRRCGYRLLPEERNEGHTCKRRAANPSAWADRARAAIKPYPKPRQPRRDQQ